MTLISCMTSGRRDWKLIKVYFICLLCMTSGRNNWKLIKILFVRLLWQLFRWLFRQHNFCFFWNNFWFFWLTLWLFRSIFIISIRKSQSNQNNYKNNNSSETQSFTILLFYSCFWFCCFDSRRFFGVYQVLPVVDSAQR